MSRLFLITLPVGIGLYYLLPARFTWLPLAWQESNQTLEFCFLIFLYTATFLGGILQLYGLADRGFSLRMMIDLILSSPRGKTAMEVVETYSAGQGVAWMYQKRLNEMKRLGLIEIQSDTVMLTPAGRRIARRLAWLRWLLGTRD